MDIYTKIASQIKEIAKHKAKLDTCLVCTVMAVNDTTCDAEYDGFELTDIRLTAIVDTTTTLLKPKVGTKILVGSIDGSLENLYVLKCQDYEIVKYQVDTSTFQIDTDAITISKSGQVINSIVIDKDGVTITQGNSVVKINSNGLSSKIEKVELSLNKDGILLNNDGETLQKLLIDMIALIQNLKVATPNGASTNLISPTPIELNDISTRIKSLLK